MKPTMHTTTRQIFKTSATLALLLATLLPLTLKQAKACAICSEWQSAVEDEMEKHEDWMTDEWWEDYVEPAFRDFTDNVRAAIVMDSVLFGAALDGQNAMQATLALQRSTTQTLKNYTPSRTICQFGSLSRSLAQSDSLSRNNQIVLGEYSQNRQLLHTKMASAEGGRQDRLSRLVEFRTKFCDPADFGSAMGSVCDTAASPDTRRNIDINFTRAVDSKATLDVNFSDGAANTNEEENIIALASNLYAHQLFDAMQVASLNNTKDKDARTSYLDQRAVVAKRSVAQNSFNKLIGDKAAGTAGSRPYMLTVLQNLGLSAADAAKYVGSNPSYDAQMEILTKKIYQNPSFYAGLMENPTNVSRQYAAMQSIGLMQQRDIFETVLRSEMLLSMILEMEVSKYQDDIQNRQNTQD